MDKNTREHVKNPRANANVFSVLTFSWLLGTFKLGYQRDLKETDLYSPLKEQRSCNLGDKIAQVWNRAVERWRKDKKGSRPSLLKSIVICFGRSIILLGLAEAFMELVISIIQPLILARLLSSLRVNRQERGNEVFYYSAGFILCLICACFFMHNSLQGLLHVGMKVRVSVCSLVYRKILKMSSSVFENDTSAGQIVNFLSSDVNRLDYAVADCNYMWIGPIQMVIITCIVYNEVGWSAVFGMLVFLIFIPIQLCFGKNISKATFVAAGRSDARLRLMNEVIGGVQIIKMYAWEAPFSRLVEFARRKEVNAIKKFLNYEAITSAGDSYLPRFSVFLTLITYAAFGNYIDAEKVYMITTYYSVLRRSMTVGFAFGCNHIFEALVTIRRVEKFLMYEEFSRNENLPQLSTKKITSSGESSLPAVSLEHATAKWNEDNKEDTLSNVSFNIAAGDFVAVVGQVGSGKSSLLLALLGELPLSSGTLKVSGKIAYASQQPWIFASSVRQNILFGQAMDKCRYDRVIEVCQLKQDISSFSHGDKTVVGEKGISLSGGQRARINLARAIYSDADIFLLDDPLSAVDARVGRKIIDECVRDYLKDKTTILVTHQLQYLRNDDRVMLINNGRIEMDDNLEVLRASGKIFAGILENTAEDEEEIAIEEIAIERELSIEEKNPEIVANGNTPVEVAETRTLGQISAKVYLSYFQACKSVCAMLIMILFTLLSQGMVSGTDYFVAYWVNVEEVSVMSRNETVQSNWQGFVSRDIILYIYTAMMAVVVLFCLAHAFSFVHVCMKCSENLHADMFRSIIRTTMSFFHANPMGRILNRFSKDTIAIDTKLPLCVFDVLLIFTSMVTVIIIIGTVNSWLLLPLTVTGCLFYFLRVVYVAVSRSVKRLEGTTRSPVFDHVGATLQGLATIRAFKAEQILTKEFDNHQDLHSSAWFIFFSSSRAFGTYIEMSCLICTSSIILIFLFLEDSLVVGNVGLVITQIIQLGWMLQWGIRQTAEMENQMTSVERVLEYSRLEEEPFLEKHPKNKPPPDWPTNGLIEFREVRLKYNSGGNYVLNGVSFTIMPKEKIGIVGRTGAGKTSLISALFRLANVEGEILIDGISTGEIALHDFRSKISIIPQEPILFAGSLRRNLDPFEEYSDDTLWQALENVELKETIAEMPAGLNSKVSEGGINFSVGQRQLLCLARALVRNNKIMVLDEATANVDHQTDSLIQKTVRKKFKDCSVLTVAHRLNTVMDSDKILVMDAGRLVEFDHPYILLQKRGYFYDMVEQTGAAMAATLIEIAEKCYYEERKEVPSR